MSIIITIINDIYISKEALYYEKLLGKGQVGGWDSLRLLKG